VFEHIEDAKSKGARVLVGGTRGELGYVQPTVLADVTTDCVSGLCSGWTDKWYQVLTCSS
jgi:hypothetical protein